MGFGGLAGFAADVHHVGTQGRGDAGEVEPIHALKDGVPVKIGSGGLLDGGVGAVIDADRAALGGALLVVVDADAVATADDLGGIDTVAAQAVDGRLANGMGGQLGDEGSVHTVVRQRHGNVGLAAAEGELQVGSLDKALVVVGLQTDHQFAKSNDFHAVNSPYLSFAGRFPVLLCRLQYRFWGQAYFCTRWMAKPATSSAR